MMKRTLFALGLLLIASGMSACVYDDNNSNNGNNNGNNENNKPDNTTDVCSIECPAGFFCSAKDKKCLEQYAPGAACENNSMCKSDKCVNNQCTCIEGVIACPNDKVCQNEICVESSLKVVGDQCAKSEECVKTAFCDEKTNRCKAYSKGGETCTANNECFSKMCNNGICGCKESSDCASGNICDVNTCRKVEPCPNNKDKKCFSALELKPNENWMGGKIAAADDDYAGNAFDIYLNMSGVVSCSYPFFILPKVQKHIIDKINALLTTIDIPAAPAYCADENHRQECQERTTPGCFMIDADTIIPFTLVEKAETPWKGRKLYADFIFDKVEYDPVSSFYLALAPEYAIKQGSPLLDVESAKESFPKVKSNSFVVPYEPAKCSKDNFDDTQFAGAPNIKKCENAYQIVMEVTANEKNSINCDNVLSQNVASVIPSEAKDALDELINNETDEAKKEMLVSMSDLIKKKIQVCYESDCNTDITEPTAEISAMKSQVYSAIGSMPYDPEKYYGYPGPMGDSGRYVWRSCRVGDVMMKHFKVYVELNDDDVIAE